MGIAVSVKSELNAMEQLGIKVPRNARMWIDANHDALINMSNSGMNASQIADWIVITERIGKLTFSP